MDFKEKSISNEIKISDSKTKVVAYCRISTSEQEKGFGLDGQKRMIKEHIKRNKDKKGRSFDEEMDMYVDSGFSGSLESRPAFDKLKENIVKGLINHIIITDFDRPFRDAAHFLKFIDFLRRYKVTIESIIQIGVDVHTHEGRLQLTFMQAFSEYEKRKISTRTMTGKIEKCRQGFIINSNIKYGFSIKKTGEDGRNKKIVLNKDEAKIVKLIFEKFSNERLTQSDIAKYLTSKKIPTRSDTDPKAKSKSRHGYGTWTQELVSEILRREEYIGLSYYGKTKTEYGTRIKLPKEEWIPVSCPAIIDKDLFYTTQKLLETKINPPRKKTADFYILSGKIWCPLCNMSYQGYKCFKLNHYYRCRGGKSRGINVENPCTNPQISGVLIEKFTWGIVKEIIGNPSRFGKNFERMIQEKNNVKKYEVEIEDNTEEIEKKKRELTSYIMMRAGSQSKETAELYDNLIGRHEVDIKELVKKNQELNKLIESELTNTDMSEMLMKLSKTFSKNMLSIENSKKDKESLLKIIINKIILNSETMDLYLNFSNENIINIGGEGKDINNENNKEHLIKLTFRRDIINSYKYDKKKSIFEYQVM